MFHIGTQHSVHARLVAATDRLEESKHIGVDPQAHRQFAFGIIDFGLRPIEIKRSRIGRLHISSTENLVIPRLAFAIGAPSRDDPAELIPFRKDNNELVSISGSNNTPAVFTAFKLRLRKDVAFENVFCLFKVDAVFSPIAFCFFVIPFKSNEVEF
jgi:hypothetical protein